MKAYKLVKFKEPLKLIDTPIPKPANDEVLVKLEASGICHSDIPVKEGLRKIMLPITLGHECAGTVEEVGKNVKNVHVGDRVSVWYVVPCDNCEICRIGMQNACPNRRSIGGHLDGGFAEYMVVPSRNVLKIPPKVSFEQGAIIACAVSTAYHATNLVRVNAGDYVAIYGLGGVGLHVAKIAKARGASMIVGIDSNPAKENIAKDFGVDYYIDPKNADPLETIKELTENRGVDEAFECIGNPQTYERALHLVRPGGRVGLVGACYSPVTFKPFDLLYNEVRIIFAVNHTLDEQRRVIDMVGKNLLDLNKSVTYRLPLSQVNEGFNMLEEQQNIVRIVLIP
ncbi:MAG: alcohol dehydrogenase catalytic domain-containing protein [Candidatus Bathyarchaeia archaeon]